MTLTVLNCIIYFSDSINNHIETEQFLFWNNMIKNSIIEHQATLLTLYHQFLNITLHLISDQSDLTWLLNSLDLILSLFFCHLHSLWLKENHCLHMNHDVILDDEIKHTHQNIKHWSFSVVLKVIVNDAQSHCWLHQSFN